MAAKDMMRMFEGESIANIDEFVFKMKSEDANNLRIAKTMYIIYFVGIFLYGGLFVLSIVSCEGFYAALSWFFIMLAFMVFAYIFWMSKNIYKKVDYSVSVIEMLRQAKDRYRLWHPMLILAIAGFYLVVFGASITMTSHLESTWTIWERLGIGNLFFTPVFLISFFFGWRRWKKRSKPSRDYASEVLKDAEQ